MLYLANTQIAEGNKDNGWSLAPEDVAQDAQNKVDTLSRAHGGLTYLDDHSIYTGTLTANQINVVGINASCITAGTLSADRIAANSLDASKIIANSITSTQINATSVSAAIATVISLDASRITTGKLSADRIDAVNVVTKGLEAQTINAQNATISNLNVVNATVSGTLNSVSGTFNYLKAVGSSGRLIFANTYGSLAIEDDDFIQQGNKNNRSLRFLSSNIRCRGSFGAYNLNMAKVNGTYIDYYVNGDTQSYVRFNLESNGIGGYYIPLYSPSLSNYVLTQGNAVSEDAGGFPVDILIFKNNSTYDYELLGATGKKIIVVNVKTGKPAYLTIEDTDEVIPIDTVSEYVNIGELVLSSAVHGAGWMVM